MPIDLLKASPEEIAAAIIDDPSGDARVRKADVARAIKVNRKHYGARDRNAAAQPRPPHEAIRDAFTSRVYANLDDKIDGILAALQSAGYSVRSTEELEELKFAQARMKILEVQIKDWLDKTEWVQEQGLVLPGQHRADAIVAWIKSLEDGLNKEGARRQTVEGDNRKLEAQLAGIIRETETYPQAMARASCSEATLARITAQAAKDWSKAIGSELDWQPTRATVLDLLRLLGDLAGSVASIAGKLQGDKPLEFNREGEQFRPTFNAIVARLNKLHEGGK